jgi:hypothetical protein
VCLLHLELLITSNNTNSTAECSTVPPFEPVFGVMNVDTFILLVIVLVSLFTLPVAFQVIGKMNGMQSPINEDKEAQDILHLGGSAYFPASRRFWTVLAMTLQLADVSADVIVTVGYYQKCYYGMFGAASPSSPSTRCCSLRWMLFWRWIQEK